MARGLKNEFGLLQIISEREKRDGKDENFFKGEDDKATIIRELGSPGCRPHMCFKLVSRLGIPGHQGVRARRSPS